MKTYLAAVAIAAALAQPAAAITFPSLTTIYVGAGVVSNVVSLTHVFCSNVSGATVNLRFLILDNLGAFKDSHTVNNLAHGRTYSVATFNAATLHEDFVFSNTNLITEGVLNIESTESGVFCNAKVADPNELTGFSLPLVRVNPHPGTVE